MLSAFQKPTSESKCWLWWSTNAPHFNMVSSEFRRLLPAYLAYGARIGYLLVSVPFLAHTLKLSTYGELLTGMALVNAISLISSYGLDAYGSRQITLDTTASKHHEILSANVSARLIALLILGATLLVFLKFFDHPVLHTSLTAAALAAGCLSALNAGWFFQGRGHYLTSALLEGSTYCMSMLGYWLLLSTDSAAHEAMWILAAASGMATLIGLWMAVRQSRKSCRLSWHAGLTIWRDAWRLSVARCATPLTSALATLYLSMVFTAAQMAPFAVAERMASAMLSLFEPARQVFLRRASLLIHAHGAFKSQQPAMNPIIRMQALLGILMTVAICLLTPLVLPIWLGESYHSALPYFMTFALAFPFVAYSDALKNYHLMPSHQDSLLTSVSVAGSLITLSFIVIASNYAHELTHAIVGRNTADILIACCLGWMVYQSSNRGTKFT
jgi:O-antigen/teichoic acid export membrane protein